MKPAKANKHRRAKAVGVAFAALAAGVGLLVLSTMVTESGRRAAEEAAAATRPAAETAAETTDEGTAEGTAPVSRVPPLDERAVSAQRLGGLLLLFALMSFGLVLITIGWIFYDVRRSRPAWMRQHKYPIRRPPK